MKSMPATATNIETNKPTCRDDKKKQKKATLKQIELLKLTICYAYSTFYHKTINLSLFHLPSSFYRFSRKS